jgi:hypothetical protein
MKRLMLFLTLTLVSAAFLGADVYIKQETVMGTQKKIQEQWLGKDKIAVKTGDVDMIVDLGTKTMYMVLHKSRSYVASSLPFDMASVMPAEMAPMMKQMMDGMTLSVQPNGKTQKILDWTANGYDVKMNMAGMTINMTFWASKDVPFEWKKYSALYSEMVKAQFRLADKFAREFDKIEGYVLAQEMNMMGMEIKVNLIELSPDKKPTGGVYAPPANYKKKEKLTPEDMRQQ